MSQCDDFYRDQQRNGNFGQDASLRGFAIYNNAEYNIDSCLDLSIDFGSFIKSPAQEDHQEQKEPFKIMVKKLAKP